MTAEAGTLTPYDASAALASTSSHETTAPPSGEPAAGSGRTSSTAACAAPTCAEAAIAARQLRMPCIGRDACVEQSPADVLRHRLRQRRHHAGPGTGLLLRGLPGRHRRLELAEVAAVPAREVEHQQVLVVVGVQQRREALGQPVAVAPDVGVVVERVADGHAVAEYVVQAGRASRPGGPAWSARSGARGRPAAPPRRRSSSPTRSRCPAGHRARAAASGSRGSVSTSWTRAIPSRRNSASTRTSASASELVWLSVTCAPSSEDPDLRATIGTRRRSASMRDPGERRRPRGSPRDTARSR